MSSLNFLVQKEFAAIATDTLALDSNTHLPSRFQSKAYPALHLDGLICGTGISQFVINWYSKVATSMLARSIPHLDEYTPSGLRELEKENPIPDEVTTTIYHFGYDQDLKRYCAYAYRSVNYFQSEELPIGFGIKPQIEFTPTEDTLKDFIDLIKQQREAELSSPIEERLGIGGDIHVYYLEPGFISIRRIHRFDDYESLYQDMCTRLPSNTNN